MKRAYRYSLRSLLLVVALMGILAWLARDYPRVARIRHARAAVVAIGGSSWLDSEFAGEARATVQPQRCFGLLCGEWFQPVVSVSLAETQSDDATLRALLPLSDLKYLDLSGTKITDDGMSVIAELANLRELRLTNTAISDAGLKFIADCIQLRKLDLSGTRVTAGGMKWLPALTELQELGLLNASVDADVLLDHLFKMPNVRVALDSGLSEVYLLFRSKQTLYKSAPSNVPALIKMAVSPTPLPQIQSTSVIERQRCKDESERIYAIEQLYSYLIVSEEARKTMLCLVNDTNLDIRCAAINGLQQPESHPELWPTYHQLLSDNVPEVRGAALDRISPCLSRKAILAIIKYGLVDKDDDVRLSALYKLHGVPKEYGAPCLGDLECVADEIERNGKIPADKEFLRKLLELVEKWRKVEIP